MSSNSALYIGTCILFQVSKCFEMASVVETSEHLFPAQIKSSNHSPKCIISKLTQDNEISVKVID